MNIEVLLKILTKYGPIFNIVHSLIDQNESNLSFGDEDEFIDEIQTCCFETVELLKNLFTNSITYYNNTFYPNDTVSLNDIYVPSFLILEINDIAELGSHYIGIIYTLNKTYVIQSFGYRYSYIVTYYNSLEELLLYCEEMINNNDPLIKIEIYNKLTHNKVTVENYNVLLDPRHERDEVLGIQAFYLTVPSVEQLLKYLNRGLEIAGSVGFRNVAKNINNAITDITLYLT
jgi:hypothetical protein